MKCYLDSSNIDSTVVYAAVINILVGKAIIYQVTEITLYFASETCYYVKCDTRLWSVFDV